MFLKISNTGICEPEAFTLLGVSTARGEENKIGQFGSGAKMGILTCLRHGMNPVIVSGNRRITFDCVSRKMGNKPYDQVVAHIDGQAKELGFALEFGAIDWTKIDYAIREFVSNAKDQGGFKIEVVPNIEDQSINSTSVYVDYTKEVKAYHENLNKYFIDPTSTVIDNNLDTFKVYRKGVLVCETTGKPALFAYNINDLKVDESRNADKHMVTYYTTQALANMSEDQANKLVKAYVNNVECVEVSNDPIYLTYHGRDKIRKAWLRVYSDLKITTVDLARYVANKKHSIVVSNKTFEVLSKCGIESAELTGNKYGIERGFSPIETSTDCKRIFNRVWGKVVKLGLHNGKDKPKLSMYAAPMDSGSTVGGYYDNGCVYINRTNVNAKVILEEIGHYVTDASDCTRDFQDWAFSVAGALL
jgi:hypothetical protein